jgi:transposase
MPLNNPPISPTKKGELNGKFKAGWSMQKLANHCRGPKSTIQGIIEHRRRTGTVKPTRRPGNPPIFNAEAEDHLVRHVRRDPK